MSEPAPAPPDLRRAAGRRGADAGARPAPTAGDDRFGADQPLEAFLDAEPAPAAEAELREQAADAAALDDEPRRAPSRPGRSRVRRPSPRSEPAPRRPVRKSRGRASVPSWDEIMFGGGKNE